MSDNMEIGGLSLDDIIKKGGAKGGKFGGKGRRSGGVQKPKRNPKAWDHDMFFKQGGSPRRGSGGARRPLASSSSTKAIARLSNIPFNITDEDLNDLFAEFPLSRVSLHYDVSGRSLGTAELHGAQGVIARLARDFKGVEIDGRPLTIQVVGGSGSSLSAGGPRVRRSGGQDRNDRRRSGGGVSKRGGGGRDSGKKKMTAEELDKELDQYMANKN